MAASFEIISADASCTHVRLRGSLDIAGTGNVSIKFIASTAAKRQHVLVEMAEVDFVSSIGLGMLMQVSRALAPEGKRVVLIAPSAAVAGVVRTSRLDAVMPITESLDAARALIS